MRGDLGANFTIGKGKIDFKEKALNLKAVMLPRGSVRAKSLIQSWEWRIFVGASPAGEVAAQTIASRAGSYK